MLAGHEPRAVGGASRRRQSGAAVVEFAFVFPILFLLVYGVVVYAYVYVIQQSITYAAQQAAEAAVAVDPEQEDEDAFTQQVQVARQMAISALSWLPANQQARVVGTGGELVEVLLCPMGTLDCPIDSDALRVTLRFDLVNPSSLFPVLDLYFVGSVPPLPDTLTASAVVRI